MSLFVSHEVRRGLGDLASGVGKVAVPSAHVARALAAAIDPEEPAAQLNALSLLEEAVQRVLRAVAGDELLVRTAEAVEEELGAAGLGRLLEAFGREFGFEGLEEEANEGAVETGAEAALIEPEAGPEDAARAREPRAPAANRQEEEAASRRATRSVPSRPSLGLVRELMIFWWLRTNPALGRLNGLLDRSAISTSSAFQAAARRFRQVLADTPGLDAGDASLLVSLEAPRRISAASPVEQLRWILPRWRSLLGEVAPEVVAGLDLAAEELAPRFGPGPGPVEAPRLGGTEGAGWPTASPESNYTEDRDWMPQLVLVAKNALVWLQQLSREYERPIRRLDEIPGEALAELAERGFTGLWLIGVWERSEASRRVKKMCGNPEAEASAYSLRGYRIAERLGGEEALADLRWRAGEHGLKLAADMVPNHTGIDSWWVLEHPERFVGQEYPPFPAYSFEGEDLSPDPNVAIRIEDHYYDRSDAAVVFQRTDKRTGEVRYLYHGNDGTSMPWNDTAQLDYLREETREAVIQEILHVARTFSVIRFDAAMTLTRMHYQRLWFPQPGDAGAIPSRAERSLTAAEFDERMPDEFWREVVDRVAEELPDTLLIAEAFWLLEGYFVRTLGMHRVYNSAFMHMLRDGDTHGYRKLLRETLEFDPAILERYVNFMSNPDEETAVEQFGSGDRYRGVCLLLATLPGLPMFAHGQVEGYSERYGMEYGRSYRDEVPNEELVGWHRQRVAPLLARRGLFAKADHFQLFDFVVGADQVDESVLAFANGTADERVLVVYNHSERSIHGRIHGSIPRVQMGAEVDGKAKPVRSSAPLTEALALDPTRQSHRLRDRLTGAERTVDYRALVADGLELVVGPYEFLLLEPVVASAAS